MFASTDRSFSDLSWKYPQCLKTQDPALNQQVVQPVERLASAQQHMNDVRMLVVREALVLIIYLRTTVPSAQGDKPCSITITEQHGKTQHANPNCLMELRILVLDEVDQLASATGHNILG